MTLGYNGATYPFVANYYGGTGNDLVLVWKGTRPYAWGNNNVGQLGNNNIFDRSVPGAVVDGGGVLAGKTVVLVAVGQDHSVALCSDGTVAAWGGNNFGQLGNNSTTGSSTPVAVTSTGVLAGKTVVAVAAGGFHSLARCSDGTVVAWGSNAQGQLGNNSTTQSSVPVAVTATGVLAGKTVVAVAGGDSHSVALCSDGTVAAWGLNANGQLGNNSTTQSNVPVAVTSSGVLAGRTVVAVAAGDFHSAALCSDGTVAAWGSNANGQLGNNSTTQSNVPVAVTSTGVLAGKTVVAVALGSGHSLARCSDGTVVAWGSNGNGQLGNNSTTQSNVPVAVSTAGALAGKTVVTVGGGRFHSLAFCSDGTGTAWGLNGDGQLGNNSTTGSTVPVTVTNSTLAAGERFIGQFPGARGSHNLALVAPPLSNNADLSGLVVSAGTLTPSFTPAGTSYTLSVPNAISSLTLTPTVAQADASITVDELPVASGSASGPITLALGSNTLTTRVTAQNGATKDYTVTVTRDSTLVATYSSASNVPVTASGWTATGSTVNFTLNFAPAVGTQLVVVKNTGAGFINGTFSNLAQGQTVTLSRNGTTYRFVANYYGGTGNDLVLVWKGTRPFAWGTNNSGQLGNNATTDSLVPVAVTDTGVLAGKTVTMVAAGTDFSVALTSDGTLAAWGTNSAGQFGNGSTTSSSVPVAVPGTGALTGKTVVAVAAGAEHSLALCSDGTVAAWGRNAQGQLGNNSTTNSSVPVAVTSSGALAGKTVVGVATGDHHSLARCSDGTVVAWGSNTQGQLGNNSTAQSNVPVAVTSTGVLAGRTVVGLAGGGLHSVALCSDGTVAAWGRNAQGQLGNSSTAQSNVPVAVTSSGVLAGRTVVAVAAGVFHSAALCSDGTLAAWGNNGEGELGNNSTTNSNVPVEVTSTGVLAGKTPIALATGGLHTLALCTDGTLAAWGYNGEGELGNNSLLDSSVPVAVTSSTLPSGGRFSGLHTGALGSHSLALVAAPQSNNANLSGLVVSAGTLTPTFTPGGISYTVSVPNTTTSLTLTPTVAQADATIQVNNVPVASGVASGSIALALGSNPLTTVVTAQNGTTKTYTVTVTRASALVATYNSASDVPVTASSWTATGSTVNFTLNFAPAVGTQLLVVRNTGNSFINGTFGNLAQGQTVTLGYNGATYHFVANYYGGTGNDLALVWKGTRPYAWGGNEGGELGNNGDTDSPVPVAVENTGVLAGKTVLAVATGADYSLALCSDGTVAAWGYNGSGRLGDNSTTDRPVPVAVTNSGVLAGKTVVAVAAGGSHSLALCSDGTVAAWGDNFYGQLGNSSTTDSSVPVAVTNTGVLAGKTVVAVAAGTAHSLALCSDGTVVAWGYNAFGGLGNNSTIPSSVPVAVTGTGVLAGRTVVGVAAGDTHSVAVCSDGTVAAWGRNDFGQLGNNSTTQSPVPVAVTSTGVLAGKTVTPASAGQKHNLVLCADGTVAAWGLNENGRLGNNSLTNSSVPVAVTNTGVLAGRTVTAVAAGLAHSLALCADGTVAAWGWNIVGQLGNNSTTDSSVPVAVTTTTLPAGGRFVGLPAGALGVHSLALVATPFSNNADLSGLVASAGTLTPSFTPAGTSYTVSVPVVISSLTLTPTAAQADATIQVNNVPVASGSPSGSIALALGSNTLTTLVTAQNGTTKTYTVTVTRDPNFTLTYHSASEVGLTVGSFSATGSTVNFALNFAPATGTQLLVVKNTGTGFINGTFDNLAQGQTVTLGYNGATYNFVANYYGGTGNDLVLVWKGTRPYAWGTNNSGQLGNNSTTQSNVPVAVTSTGVLAGKTVTMVAAGTDFSVALCSDGTLAAWGTNASGQFGNGSTTSSSVPVAVPGTGALAGKTVVGVAVGDHHSLARCSDGTVVAWGRNGQGQLGNNSIVQSNVPVAVTGTGVLAGRTVVGVAGGGVHSVALCSDGTVVAWGGNTQGQLGNNSIAQSNVPVAVTSTGVLAGKTVVAVAASELHSVALCADGTLAAWGYNAEGELGNNSTTNSAVPVAVTNTGVLAGKTAVALATGGLHTLALCSDGTLAAWGYNGEGELGNNSTTDSPVPVAVTSSTLPSGGRFSGLHTGALGSHSLALVAAPQSNNANLSGLVVSAGTLTPTFTPTGTSYTVSVPNAISSLTLTPTAAQADATIQVNNVPVASGSASGAILLNGGSNPVTMVVTAPDGTLKTYAVTVNRDPNLGVTFNSASAVGLTADSYTATGCTVNLALNFAPTAGAQLRVIDNTGTGFIGGAFSNLAQGQTVSLAYQGSTYQFVANYYGGTGNDLVLVWKGTRAYAWGRNGDGELGNNSTTGSSVPVAVSDAGVLAGKTVVMVAVGQYHNVALCSDGTLAAWGRNANGQLGNNTLASSSVPVAVDRTGVLAGRTPVAVAAGAFHSLVLCSDGTVVAWGLNSNGQLGNNSTTDSSVPVVVTTTGVLSGRTVVALAAGGYHGLALCSDGTLAAWGRNSAGGLGNNSLVDSPVPVAVDRTGALAGRTVTALAAGYLHSLVLCADGTVVGWGYNAQGQLGNSSTTNSAVPVAVTSSGVLAGRTVVGVSAGDSHNLALCSDGTVAAWGLNDVGQLGNNSTVQSTVPVTVTSTGVLAGKTVVAVVGSNRHSAALCSDGTLTTWGLNLYGQLGNNSTTNSSVPPGVTSSNLADGALFIGLFSGCEGYHSVALVAPAPPTVAEPQVGGVTATTALLGGAVNSDGGSAIIARGVVFAPTAVNANPRLGGVGVLNAAGSGTLGLFVLPVGGLTPGTDYSFATYASNDLGTSYSAADTFTTLTALQYWRQTWYFDIANSGDGADSTDPYATGVPNLLVFAFFGPAQDPALARVSQLPQPAFAGGNLSFNFTQPGDVSGVTYGAEWCTSLSLGNWQPVADTGTGGQHIFSVPAAGNAKVFLRLKVTSP